MRRSGSVYHPMGTQVWQGVSAPPRQGDFWSVELDLWEYRKKEIYRPLVVPSNSRVRLPPIPVAEVQRARWHESTCLNDPNIRVQTPNGRDPHRPKRDNLFSEVAKS